MLTNNVLLPDGLKKKLFDTKMAQAAVLVQSTRKPLSTPDHFIKLPSEQSVSTIEGSFEAANDQDFVFIRKFCSVKDFI